LAASFNVHFAGFPSATFWTPLSFLVLDTTLSGGTSECERAKASPWGLQIGVGLGISRSEKIAQPRELKDVLCGQDGTYWWRLWRSMYFVQVAHGRRLGHELPDALIKGAVDEGIGTTALGTTLVAEWRPFAKNSTRIEIDVSLGAAHRSRSFAWEYMHEAAVNGYGEMSPPPNIKDWIWDSRTT
jgi:hypothetical protein